MTMFGGGEWRGSSTCGRHLLPQGEKDAKAPASPPESLTVTLRSAKSRKLIVLVAAASALLVASCNTVAGAGKDVAAAGKAVTSTAEDAKH